MNRTLFVIGLMSGTSMDGIDGTVLKTNGVTFTRTMVNETIQYRKETKEFLNELENEPLNLIKNIKKFKLINKLVTEDHLYLAEKIIEKIKYKPDLIGFHGQTIYHSSKKRISIQIGDAQLLANNVKIEVAGSFRKNDLKYKGQGAPLSPIYHQALAKDLNLVPPVCFINIGGVANITYYDENILIGFDTGPGNGLMDRFMQEKLSRKYDKNGEIASLGNINKNILKKFENHKFFTKKFPKSLDKLSFNHFLTEILYLNMSSADILATLAELTASTISKSFSFLPKKPNKVVLLGGGQYNTHLVNRLKANLTSRVYLSKDFNLSGKFIEAELFAYLAARTKYNLPITYPLTTGAKSALTGGEIFTPLNLN